THSTTGRPPARRATHPAHRARPPTPGRAERRARARSRTTGASALSAASPARGRRADRTPDNHRTARRQPVRIATPADSLRTAAAAPLQVTPVFVSHTHIDHFIGFDHLLRMFLARDLRLDLFGPPGIIANVRGKLAGYTWNLVDGYPFVLTVHEVAVDRIRWIR